MSFSILHQSKYAVLVPTGVVRFLLIVCIVLLLATSVGAQWVSGEAIPVAGPNSVGPLSGGRGYTPVPMGTADVFGNGPYDLFVNGRLLYPFVEINPAGVPVYGAPQAVSGPGEDTYGDYLTSNLLLGLPLNQNTNALSGQEEVSYTVSLEGNPEVLVEGGVEFEGSWVEGIQASRSASITGVAQTWAAWIHPYSLEKPGAYTSTHPHSVAMGLNGPLMRGFLRIFDRQVQYGWNDGANWVDVQSQGSEIPLGEWTHICGRNDGINQPSIFINGEERPVLVTELGDYASRVSLDGFRIGYQSVGTRGFDGAIRDVRVYSGALSDEEIAALAAAPTGIIAQGSSGRLHPGSVVQGQNGKIHGYYYAGQTVLHATYSISDNSFVEQERTTLSIPSDIRSLGALVRAGDALSLILGIADGKSYLPPGVGWREEEFFPFDGAGIWLGELNYDYLYSADFSSFQLSAPTSISQISSSNEEILFEIDGIALVNLGPGKERDLICGGQLGLLYYYHNTAADGLNLEPMRFVRGTDGLVFRHPSSNSSPVSFANPTTGLSDLLVGSADGILYYEFTEQFTQNGAPIYADSEPVLQQEAKLNVGAFPVITAGDLNDDSLLDLVAGNQSGGLYYLENAGSESSPDFLPPQPLMVGGSPLEVRAGYRGSIQGPREARWGYTSPSLYDWDGDGLLDILLSNIFADYFFLKRKADTNPPEFEAMQPIYLDGLDLHTTWRNQPAITDWGSSGNACLVTFDDTDRLRRYWKVDAHNVTEGELLSLEDGRPISANYLFSGGTGRIKLQLVDWDLDGKIDLLAGTNKHSSIPSPTDGLPYILGEPGATVLYLRNVGTNADPEFAFPKMFTYQGEPILLGDGATSPVAVDMGKGGLDLIVGEERGSLIYFARADLVELPVTGWMVY